MASNFCFIHDGYLKGNISFVVFSFVVSDESVYILPIPIKTNWLTFRSRDPARDLCGQYYLLEVKVRTKSYRPRKF